MIAQHVLFWQIIQCYASASYQCNVTLRQPRRFSVSLLANTTYAGCELTPQFTAAVLAIMASAICQGHSYNWSLEKLQRVAFALTVRSCAWGLIGVLFPRRCGF